MKYFFFLSIVVFFFDKSYGQEKIKTLYIIDSIPLLSDPEAWDQLLPEDIADTSILDNKDSIQNLGWEKIDTVVYVFTKAYRSRPDSVKQIPSLKQMLIVNDAWTFHNEVYTGKYRNYYLDGQLQAEGLLLNGKIDGVVTAYFENGITKSVTVYSLGKRHGEAVSYYKNGTVFRRVTYINNAQIKSDSYFINGQLQDELKTGIASTKDTLIRYYSSGKIRSINIAPRRAFDSESRRIDLNFYTTMFYEHIREKNLKSANKDFFHIKKLDPGSIETIFIEGVLLLNEFRFAKAIEQFNEALKTEPLMKEAFAQRAISRIKLFKYKGIPLNDIMDAALSVNDLEKMPEDEQAKVCSDIMMADQLDINLQFTFDEITEDILRSCARKKITEISIANE